MQVYIWFQQAEAQFIIHKITKDEVKYSHIIAALDQETAGRLLDLLRDPPNEHKYEARAGNKVLNVPGRDVQASWILAGHFQNLAGQV